MAIRGVLVIRICRTGVSWQVIYPLAEVLLCVCSRFGWGGDLRRYRALRREGLIFCAGPAVSRRPPSLITSAISSPRLAPSLPALLVAWVAALTGRRRM